MTESYENERYRLWAENHPEAAEELCALQNEAALRRRLKEKFNVPDDFMNTAAAIWWDGKED